ncbi:MAG: PEP-CTERM sorting domain-containing protein [Deltaproteobacteria bacterium]|nr:PEP-CTERM sorting domain-containing protein [Deltaproteobacteria bacterium]
MFDRSFGRRGAMFALALTLGAGSASAATLVSVEDRWFYAFAGGGGSSNRAPTFGANAQPDFDNRDGQFLVEFDTSGAFAVGQGASSYVVHSARVEVTVIDGTFVYDGTYDGHASYFGGTDLDAGRPVELYGVGYRNGNGTTGTNLETVSFAPPGPPATGVRNAYATDFLAGTDRDVSNNVAMGFDPTPFAVGTTALAPGDPVPGGTVYGFDFVLGADAIAYLQSRLDLGRVDLAITSLHDSSFGGAATYPAWATRENTAFSKPTLFLDVTVVPEPGTFALVSAGLAGLAAIGGRRR